MDINLIGEKVILKPMGEKDAQRLHELTKHPDLNKYSGPYNAATSVKKAQEYIKNCKINIVKRKSYCLGIYLKETGELVGNIGFVNIDEENSKGEIGFWIGREHWNKGYMTEATKLMTDFCLNNLGFNKVSAFFHELNNNVKKLLEKNGYQFEEKLKKSIKTNGKDYDEIIYVKINS